MEDTMEFVGHLQAELLSVKDSLRMNEITEAEAINRIRAIQRRARSGDNGYLRPRPQPSLFASVPA